MTSSLITKKFSTHLTDLFINSITGALVNTNYYLAISHVDPWANDSSPNTALDSRKNEVLIWRGMIGGKKVTGNDIYHVVIRNDWSTNTIYTAYTDENCFYSNNFYVLTDEFNVYKCIGNNQGGLSVNKPTYVSVDRTNTENDGYIWKYLYTLNTEERIRFLTSDWLPVHFQSLNDGSLQYQVEQNAVDGSIEHIYVSNGGVGYTNSSNVSITIDGDGSSANAIANVNVTSQTISFITMTNPGSSYHFANVIISDSGNGSGAIANARISPVGGHGFNPVEELGASNIMINIRLKNDENGKLTLQNDYRQISLIRNPLLYGVSNTLFTNTVFNQTTTLTVSSGSDDYQLDEYVYQGTSLESSTFSGRVVDWYNSNSTMRIVEISGTPTAASLIGANSGVSRFLATTTFGELTPYSGSVLYLDNVSPVTRNVDQTEDIKIIIRF